MSENAAILFRVGDMYRCETLTGELLAEAKQKNFVVRVAIESVKVLFIDSSVQEKGS